jgi:hypothetical protein
VRVASQGGPRYGVHPGGGVEHLIGSGHVAVADVGEGGGEIPAESFPGAASQAAREARSIATASALTHMMTYERAKCFESCLLFA